MFVDEVIVKIKAGNGGDGCLAFRREKYVPLGGPYGGNGGKGSDIIFKVDAGLRTLLDLRYQKIIKGKKGENGEGKNKHGANARNIIIKVPQGTVVTDTDTGFVIADLKNINDQALIAIGGRGGRGNTAFKTQTNPAPNFAENGEPGEERTIKVELKLMADVGLVGLPSVGKSTILSKVSRSNPKIAAYHFTTLSPNLGVVKTLDGRTFVLADLPGLIEGASQGEGLGDQFLRHIERTKVIVHVIDMSGFEGRDPYDDYITINNELASYNLKLLNKPEIIIANKMDGEGSLENLQKFKSKVDKKIFAVSAINNQGLDEVMMSLMDLIETIKEEPLYNEDAFESHVLYKFKKESPYKIYKEGDIFIVKGEEIEKLLKMTNFSSTEAALCFAHKLKKMGIDDKLKEMGAKENDKVQILNFTFDFKD